LTDRKSGKSGRVAKAQIVQVFNSPHGEFSLIATRWLPQSPGSPQRSGSPAARPALQVTLAKDSLNLMAVTLQRGSYAQPAIVIQEQVYS